MIRGAIFDLDGTLLDSMSIWDTIGETYLRSLGKEPKEDLKETFKTFTMEQSAQYCADCSMVNVLNVSFKSSFGSFPRERR